MYINLAFLAFGVILPLHMVHGNFQTECERGVIDFGKELMDHLEDNFPEVTESASRELTKIYSHAIKLVENDEQENQLHDIHDGIAEYLKGCNELFMLNDTFVESMDSVEDVLTNMKVHEICRKPREKVYVFKEIIQTRVVSKILSLEYFDSTFSVLLSGAAKTINTLFSTGLCVLKDCSRPLKRMLKDSFGDIIHLAKGFLGDALTDIQGGLVKVFRGHFEKLECKVDKGFKDRCDVLKEEVEEIKRKLNRQLRNYQDCLDDKSYRLGHKTKTFQDIKTLLKL